MKRVLIFLVVAALILSLAACAPSTPGQQSGKPALKSSYKVGISQRWGTVPFLRTIVAGAEKAKAEWEKKLGVKIELLVKDCGNDDPSKQINDMQDLAAQKIDGLLIFPGDSAVVVEPIKDYNKKGIPVIVTDIGIDGGEYQSFIITDNRKGGQLVAESMSKVLKKGDQVVVFDTGPGNNNTQQRINGFKEKIKEYGIEVVDHKEVAISVEAGKKLMEDMLVKYPDLDGVFCTYSVATVGAVNALVAAKNTHVQVGTFDLDKDVLQMVKDGTLHTILVQDPFFMGEEGMNQLFYFLTGETGKIQKNIGSQISVCTKENASDYDNNPLVK